MDTPQSWRRLAFTLVSCLALSACSFGPVGGPGDASVIDLPGSRQQWGLNNTFIGEPLYFGLWLLHVNGHSVVHLTSVEVVGMPKSFVIDRIWGARYSETKSVETARGEAGQRHLVPLLHPITSLYLDPDCRDRVICYRSNRSLQGDPAQDWYITVQAHVTAIGSYKSSGALRFTYDVSGKHYQQTIDGQTIAASTSSNMPPTSPSS